MLCIVRRAWVRLPIMCYFYLGTSECCYWLHHCVVWRLHVLLPKDTAAHSEHSQQDHPCTLCPSSVRMQQIDYIHLPGALNITTCPVHYCSTALTVHVHLDSHKDSTSADFFHTDPHQNKMLHYCTSSFFLFLFVYFYFYFYIICRSYDTVREKKHFHYEEEAFIIINEDPLNHWRRAVSVESTVEWLHWYPSVSQALRGISCSSFPTHTCGSAVCCCILQRQVGVVHDGH